MPARLPDIVPAPAKIILDFIGAAEAPAGYGTIYGNKQGKLAKPLTDMTFGEVVDAQAYWSKRHGSSAAGRYQFMRKTLQRLSMKYTEITGLWLFDERLQDRLGFVLLLERGYDDFIAGRLSLKAFGNNLAKEWASFPVLAATKGAHRDVRRGETFYAGDGVNKVLVDPEAVEELLTMARAKAKATDDLPSVDRSGKSGGENRPKPEAAARPAPKPLAKSGRFWTWLMTGGISVSAIFEKIGSIALDWRVQIALLVVVVGFAIYAIATMPAVRAALGMKTDV